MTNQQIYLVSINTVDVTSGSFSDEKQDKYHDWGFLLKKHGNRAKTVEVSMSVNFMEIITSYLQLLSYK